MWQRCSKTEFVSLTTVQTAVNIATLTFNRGNRTIISLAELMGCKLSVQSATFFRKRDEVRIRVAQKNLSVLEKKKRKAESRRKATAEDLLRRSEGDTYLAGAF